MFSRTDRGLALGSALIAVALAVSACGGSTGDTASTGSTAAGSTTTGPASPVAAHTGFNPRRSRRP